MKKDCRHTIKSRCFCWVELLKCIGDFVSCENLGKLSIHILRNTPRHCTSDLTNTTWGGSGVNLLKVRNCSGNNVVLTLTPDTTIIPQPLFFLLSEARAWKNFVFWSPSLYQCVLLHCLQMVSSQSKSSLISSASVYHGERIESSFLFLNFLWNIAYHIPIPIC